MLGYLTHEMLQKEIKYAQISVCCFLFVNLHQPIKKKRIISQHYGKAYNQFI
jgi:hypothetical protein